MAEVLLSSKSFFEVKCDQTNQGKNVCDNVAERGVGDSKKSRTSAVDKRCTVGVWLKVNILCHILVQRGEEPLVPSNSMPIIVLLVSIGPCIRTHDYRTSTLQGSSLIAYIEGFLHTGVNALLRSTWARSMQRRHSQVCGWIAHFHPRARIPKDAMSTRSEGS